MSLRIMRQRRKILKKTRYTIALTDGKIFIIWADYKGRIRRKEVISN